MNTTWFEQTMSVPVKVQERGLKLLGIVMIASSSLLCAAQEVHVSPVKDGVNVSLPAVQPYEIMPGQKKRGILSIQCTQNQKGTKSVHLVMFSAGESIAEDNAETRPKNGEITLNTELDGKKGRTNWIPYGDAVTYAFYGKQEPERVSFLQILLNAETFSVEFTPFLTGVTLKSVFQISKLREEVAQHPECAIK